MTAQVIEMSKETTTSANGVTTVAGSNKPAATGQVGEQTGLMEAFRLPPTELDAVKSLYFPEGEGATCEADTYCNGGTELSYTVTGWARNHEAVRSHEYLRQCSCSAIVTLSRGGRALLCIM